MMLLLLISGQSSQPKPLVGGAVADLDVCVCVESSELMLLLLPVLLLGELKLADVVVVVV